ncbi:MAG: hypothetical protein ACE5IQ_03500 [Candidatus Methylomirabilales bacterium]
MRWSVVCTMALAGLLAFASPPVEAAYHGSNPCAANPCNPCAAKAMNPCAANPCNPCAAKNPCAANPCNPCAAKGVARGPIPVRTVWGQVVSASPRSLAVKTDGRTLNLQLTRRTEIKMASQGMERKTLRDIRPGARVAVSFLDNNGSRRAAYVYLTRAAANPCAANPCNPCAAKNPCAGRSMNPCNPCGARR